MPATNKPGARVGQVPNPLNTPPFNPDHFMTRHSEILFIDPAVADIGTLLSGVRPEVEAIVLDAVRPAARQVAAALADRRGLDAVHIVTHGAPGRTSPPRVAALMRGRLMGRSNWPPRAARPPLLALLASAPEPPKSTARDPS